MTTPEDRLAKVRETWNAIDKAQQEVDAARRQVAAAQAAVGTAPRADKATARKTLAKASEALEKAEALLKQRNADLARLLQDDTQGQGAKNPVSPVWWCIATLLLTLSAIFLLAAIFGWSLWPSKTGETLSSTAVYTWLGVTTAILGLGLATVIFAANRMTRSGFSPAGWLAASSNVPASRIKEAAQRVEDAKQGAQTAQDAVDKAQVKADQAPVDEKNEADEELAKAQAKLAAAQDALRFEQQQLAVLMGGTGIASINLQYLVFGSMALIVLAFLMYGIINQVLLPSLASISISRGLITFLIAVVTVTIALILVLATIVSESQDRASRFTQGKEVLTMLIGVLGTIVGFYFGNSVDGTRTLEIATPFVSNESPTVGEKIDITSFVAGGKALYTIGVVFHPPNIIADVKDASSTDGSIRLTGLEIKDAKDDTRISYQIKVRDSGGRTGFYDSGARGRDLVVKEKANSVVTTPPETTPKPGPVPVLSPGSK